MRIFKRALLTGVMSVSLIALVGAEAVAGGPTSVIVVNPMSGATGSLYVTNDDYGTLMQALDGVRVDDGGPPAGMSDGPGSPSTINVTWLAHDVWVWRVDRINVHTDGTVWIRSYDALGAEQAEIDWEAEPDWKQSADSAALLGVLDRMGVLDPADGSKAIAGQTLGSEDEMAAQIATTWWWALPAALVGLVIGLVGRPYLATWVARRERGPRHQLVDG
jgi:hypothetical protein